MKISDKLKSPVFYWFERLSSVPHGSGNTSMIADICVEFARERGLEHYRDELNNVIIIKEASPGYENSPAVIIQGHLDMVCAKADGCEKDMSREAVELMTDGEWVWAKDTSLGGDNAVAVAAALAMLDGGITRHGRIECVFTVDEETGMYGADFIDVSCLKGKMLLNLDSEDEGVFTVSCAGGVRADCRIEGNREPLPKGFSALEIRISGLLGGHSGVDMGKGRAGADRLAARLLFALQREFDIRLCGICAGEFDNVIPKSAVCTLALEQSKAKDAAELVSKIYADIKNEYSLADPDICITLCPAEEGACFDKDATQRIIYGIYALPYHVQRMSDGIEGLIETSLNTGTLSLDESGVSLGIAVRSSVESERDEVVERIRAVMALAGGTVQTKGAYPGW